MKNKKKIISGVFIALVLVFLVVLGTNLINTQKEENPELLKARTYAKVESGEDSVAGTDYVKFDAYYLCDLNSDGIADKVRGTCKEIGTQDTLYIDLNVISQGTLKNAAITINGSNFYFSTALVKDNVIAKDYIGEDIKEIALNDVPNGTQKLLFGMVQSGDYAHLHRGASAIGNDTKKYSSAQNTITLTGTYVAEDGTEIPISKTVFVTNDWYGKATAEMDIPTNINGDDIDIESAIDDYYKKFKVDFQVKLNEKSEEVILSKSHVDGVAPLLNGYAPTNVICSNQNAVVTYDPETRQFVIENIAQVDSNGIVKTTVSREQTYNITIEYPLEAYETTTADAISLNVPINGYFEGFNNTSSEFTNPVKSNVVQDTLSLIYKNPSGDVAIVEVGVGSRVYDPENDVYRYVVLKDLPMNIYNLVETEKNEKDEYVVQWRAYTGREDTHSPFVLVETPENYGDVLADVSNNRADMTRYASNTGIYFVNPKGFLGNEGFINVYENDTNELLHTFTSEDWNEYDEKNPYRYDRPVKHIRIETSVASTKSYLFAYNIKEIDDSLITANYNEEQFRNLNRIHSYLTGYLVIDGENAKINSAEGAADYDLSYSVANISVDPYQILNQQTQEGITLRISTETGKYVNKKWQNGEFLIKYPAEVVAVDINSATTLNSEVAITAIETYEEDGNVYTKIFTSSDTEKQVDIVINANITADPRNPTMTRNIELYYYNPDGHNYEETTRVKDIYDLNANSNLEEYVGHSSTQFNIIAPSNLLTSQVGKDYDDLGSVVVAPQEATIVKLAGTRDATVAVGITNNYSNTISEIKIVGKIPFKGNTYQLNGKDLGSTFDTIMQEGGITIPEELKPYVTVYYSYNEEVTQDIAAKKNGWTTTPDDWSKVKCYLIDLGSYVITKGDTEEFSYRIKVPNGLNYNDVSYADHAVYYALDTDEGKLYTQTEPTKLGFRIIEKFDLEITKYQKNSNKLVQGVTFVAENASENDTKTATTNLDGVATLKNLYVEREYIVKEVRTNNNYVLDTTETKIIAHYVDGELQIEVLEGGFKSVPTIVQAESSDVNPVVKVDIENEVKYTLELDKTQLGTNVAIEGIKFELTDYNGKTKEYSTDENGKLILRLLEPYKQYTLNETDSLGHYMKEPVSFVMVRDADGNLKLNVISGDLDTLPQVNVSGNVPVVTTGIKNEKIPTYSLKITKKESDTETVLKGAQFKIIGDGKPDNTIYTTDENGVIQIDNIYQYVEGKELTCEYTLTEIFPSEGYILDSTPIVFKAYKDASGNLKFDVLSSGSNLRETIEEIVVENPDSDNPIVKITIDNDPVFTLTKVDEEGNPLEGVEFKVTDLDENIVNDANGNSLGSVFTDNNGKIRLSLSQGLYKAFEINTLEGYKLLDNYVGMGIGESKKAEYQAKLAKVATEERFDFSDVIDTGDGIIAVSAIFNNSIVKFDYSGNVVWEIAGGSTVINGMDLSAYNINYYGITRLNDGFAVVGRLAAGSNNYLVLRRFDDFGNIVSDITPKQITDDFPLFYAITSVGEDIILAGDGGAVIRLDKNFDTVWSVNFTSSDGTSSPSFKGVAVYGDTVYAVADAGQVGTVNFTTGTAAGVGAYVYEYKDIVAVNDGVVAVSYGGQLVKYDASGTQSLLSTAKTYPYSAITSADNGASVIAVANSGEVVKYNASNGAVIWEQKTNNHNSAVVETSEGVVVVSGESGMPYVKNGVTSYHSNYTTRRGIVEYLNNSTGVVDETKRNDANSSIGVVFKKAVQCEDGFVTIGCFSDDEGYATLGITAKYDNKGHRLWIAEEDGYAHNDVVVLEDGGVVVIGDQRITKYNSSGIKVWEENSAGYRYVSGVAVGNEVIASTRSGEMIRINDGGAITYRNTDKTYHYYGLSRIDDGIIAIVLGAPGRVVKYSLDCTQVLWDRQIEYQCIAVAQAADGNGIYVGGNGGSMTKLDSNGNILWSNLKYGDYYVGVVAEEDGVIGINASGVVDKRDLDGNFIWTNNPDVNASELSSITESGMGLTSNGELFEVSRFLVEPEIPQSQSVVVENKLIEHKITTDVEGFGGTISGKGEEPYESVKHLNDSQKEIIAQPGNGYMVASVTINDQPVEFLVNEDGSVNIDKFIGMVEDKHVVVSFANKDEALVIKKIDAKDGTPLAGAKFSIKPILADGTVDATNETIVETNTNGEAASQLSNGNYQVTEIEAPEGYTLDSTPRTYTMVVGEENILTFENRQKTDVIVHHYIKDTTTPIADDELIIGDIGEDYSTSPKTKLTNYQLVKNEDGTYQIPENASGVFIDGTQVVTYYYELKPLELVVHHYVDGTEDKVAEDESQYGYEGDNYTTSPVEHPELDERYELVVTKLPENANGIFTEPYQEVIYYYQLIEHKITTEVEGVGGSITGEGENPYEIVYHKDNSVKDIIVRPSTGYEISKITINGVDQVLPENKAEEYMLDKFAEMVEDKHIVVSFKIITDNVNVYKVWDDNDNVASKRPESIKVELRNGSELVSDTIMNSGNGDYNVTVSTGEVYEKAWKYTFENVPMYDEFGNPLTYRIVEKEVNTDDLYMYEESVKNINAQNYIIINKFTVPDEKTELEVTKKWADTDETKDNRPAQIKLQVKNGDTVVKEQVINVDANETQTYKFTELPKYDVNGNEISYNVDEVEVNTDDLKFYEKSIDNDTHIVTNTFRVPDEKVELDVTKKWVDNNNANSKRPAQIKLQVKDGDTVVKEQVINVDANETQTYKFTDLAKYDENGNDKVYTIDEAEVNVDDLKFYEKSIDNDTHIVTNTFKVPDEKIELDVTKKWVDTEETKGKRPTQIKLQVKDGDTVVKEQVINIDANETQIYKFTDLTKYDENGNEKVYTVDEVEINTDDLKFYEKSMDNDTHIVTNTFKVPDEKIELDVTKKWVDNNNANSKRPAQIKLQVKDGDTVVKEQVINVDVNETQTHKFTELPKYDVNGNEISYKVDEVEVNADDLKFYEKSIDNNTHIVTNTFKVPDEKIELDVTKKWVDTEETKDKRPARIKLQVKDGDTVVKEQEINVDANETQTYKFTDLAKYDENGNEKIYTVDEVEINTGDLKFYEKSIDNNTHIVTNTFQVPDEKIELDVTKKWVDNNNENSKRPTQIKLQVKDGDTVVKEQVINVDANETQTHKFTELPKYDVNGNEISYKVDEVEVNADDLKFYEKSIDNDTHIVTNTFKVPDEKIELDVTKKWVDTEETKDKRPARIKLQVKDGDTVVKEQEINVDANETQTYKFTDLAKYDENGNEKIYTVDEVEINTGDLKFYEKSIDNDTHIVTNTFRVPDEKIELNVTKKWVDTEETKDKRPTQIKLQVKDGDTVVKEETINVDAADTQNYTFTDLPKYDINGNEISYKVDEAEVNTDDLKFYGKAIDNNTHTITNSFKVLDEKIEIGVTKKWVDTEETKGKRPAQIKLLLKKGEEIVGEEVVNVDANETQTVIFEDLLRYDESGNQIEYTVDESELNTNDLKFYEKSIDNDTHIVTNTFKVPDEKTEVTVTKKWVDDNNKNGIRPTQITLQVKERSTDSIVREATVEVTPDNERVYTFENLNKYDAQGNEVDYYIDEIEVEGYTKTISENVITNAIKQYNITTEVKGVGGDISGKDENPYETVNHGGNSVKDIVITPENGYKISKITINGEDQELPENPEEEYTLDKFTNVIEDIHVVVEFEKKEYKITTEVEGEGGDISGKDENPYETVLFRENSVKDIIATPDSKYEIESIKINGEPIAFTPEEDGSFLLDKFIEVTEDKHVVVKFSKKDAQVLVKYVDIDTKVEIYDREKIKGEIDEDYTTVNKLDEINERHNGIYEFVESTDNTEGKITEEPITVIYYYTKKLSSIEVNYLEVGTDKVLAEKVEKTGKVTEDYTTENKLDEINNTFNNKYEFVKVEGNANGKYTLEKQVITYYYQVKKTKVTVKYVDIDTNEEIYEEIEIEGKIDDEYKTENKLDEINDKFDNSYDFVKVDGQEEGTMTEDGIEVTYYYKRKPATVIVKHIDVDTDEEISEEEVLDGRQGEEYKTSSKKIDGYELVIEKLPENANGRYSDKVVEIRYYYKKIVEKEPVTPEVKPDDNVNTSDINVMLYLAIMIISMFGINLCKKIRE